MNPVPDDSATKRSTLRWLVIGSLVLLCLVIMLPRLLSPQFGLFDDGRTVAVARSVLGGNFDSIWEPLSGRSRPIYWLYNALLFWLAGPAPILFFVANLFILIVLTVGIGWLVLRLGGGPLQAWLSACLFALSGPIVESFYTLSKPEPLQLMWMLIAILASTFPVNAFWSLRNGARLVGVASALLLADLTKETSIVLVPLGLAWWIIVRWRDRRQPATALQSASLGFLLASILAASVFGALRLHFSVLVAPAASYGANYQLGLGQMTASAVRWGGWLLYDSTWLLPLLIFLVIRLLMENATGTRLWIIACLVWMLTWLLLYLPWKYAVEYYLLPEAAGGAIAGGLAVRELVSNLKANRGRSRLLTSGCLALSLCLLLGNGLNSQTNARVQLAIDAANHDMLDRLAASTPTGGRVVVNIREANEYVDEIKLHLAELWNRPDLNVVPFMVQGDVTGSQKGQASIIVAPFLRNEPSLSVRLGLVEASSTAWDDSLLAFLGDPATPVFKSERQVRLLIVDFPRMLCPMMRAVAYCREDKPVIDLRNMEYGWNGFRSPAATDG